MVSLSSPRPTGVASPAVPVGIRAIRSFLPRRRLTNADLVRLGSPVTEDWIVRKTGIRSRYVVAPDEAMSDLALPAARRALRSAGLRPRDVDAIVVSGDRHDSGGVQLTSALVAHALGIDGVSCFDLRVGCPSAALALHVASSLVASGLAGRVLTIVAEVNTRDLDITDRTAVWFGDAAAAVVVERCAPDTGILATFVAGSGADSQILTVPAGGSRESLTAEGLARGRNQLFMDGPRVFPFAVDRMVESLTRVTAHFCLTPKDLDLIFPHQANLRIVEAALSRMGLPRSRAFVNIERVGNTAGPSLLVALDEAQRKGVARPGQLVATVGFGGGLAWGAQLIRLNSAADFPA